MRPILFIAAAASVLMAASCKKTPDSVPADHWSYSGQTYKVLKTYRRFAGLTSSFYATNDTSGSGSGQVIDFEFMGYPTASGIYKITSFPTTKNEVSIMTLDPVSFKYYASNSSYNGTAYVSVVNNKILLSLTNVWMKEELFTGGDSVLLSAAIQEK